MSEKSVARQAADVFDRVMKMREERLAAVYAVQDKHDKRIADMLSKHSAEVLAIVDDMDVRLNGKAVEE